jgi:hypothetical protein
MAEKYSIMRTQRWGHGNSTCKHMLSVMRSSVKKQDDIIRTCNEMISNDTPVPNETITYDLYLNRENGDSNIIHSVERDGGKAI